MVPLTVTIPATVVVPAVMLRSWKVRDPAKVADPEERLTVPEPATNEAGLKAPESVIDPVPVTVTAVLVIPVVETDPEVPTVRVPSVIVPAVRWALATARVPPVLVRLPEMDKSPVRDQLAPLLRVAEVKFMVAG
jgi:hypothetical protein